MSYATFETWQLLTSGGEPALFLLDMALKATAIILAAIALSLALRRASAATRHLLWSASLVGLLALPVLAYSLPDWRVAVLPESLSAASNPSVAPEVEVMPQPVTAIKNDREPAVKQIATTKTIAPAQSDRVAGPAQRLQEAEAVAPAPSRSFHWSRWVLLVWFAGFLISIGRLALGIATVWWLSRTANEITDATWTALADDIGRQLDLPRRVALLKSSRIAMPQTWGTLSPAVLLPADADEWSIERRRVVLMHELAHVKRRDCLTQVMAQVSCSFYWFNPLVWMAARRLRMERELACDDQVLEKGTRASDYADLLLDIARTLHSGRCSSLTAVAMARQSQLEGRLLAILNPSLNRKGLNRLKASILVIALALVILPLASLRPTAQAKASQRGEGASSSPADASANQAQAKLENQISHASITSAKSESASAVDEPGEELPAKEPGEPDQEDAAEPAEQDQQSGEQPPSGGVQALLDALKDNDPEVREQAIFALSQVGGSAAVEALKQAMSSDNYHVRKQAAWGLGMHGDQGAVDLLIAALRDQHREVRSQAAWSLGMKGDSRAVEPLVAALKDEETRVRAQAAWALGMKGDSRAVAGLIEALKDSGAQVRSQAAWALGMKGNGESVDALIAALKDPSAQVRTQAAWALGMKGAQRAIEPLNEAMKDESPQVRQTASWALGMLLTSTRDLKIKVKLDNKIKFNPGEMEIETDDINVDPESDPDPNPNPARQRRRGQRDRNNKDN